MNAFTQFSNSWGHLIMSIVLIIVGTVLVLMSGDSTIKGIGVTLIMTPTGYWFVSSVAMHNQHPPQPPQGSNP